MPRCTHCGHEFAVSEGFKCPACAKDWRGPAPAPAQDSGRPAHLALLDAGASAAPAAPKPRIVSSAGPSVPVMKRQDDSVPAGWMARLEVARAVAQNAGAQAAGPAPEAPPPPPAPSAPPPLKAALAKKGNGLETTPAHLLVARLEADEKKRTEGQAADLFSEPAHQELISQVKVELPKAPKKKKVPDWVVMLGLAALVVGGVGAVYSAVKKEPPPKAVVDPALEAAAERRKMAMAALEEGHTFALEGQKGADQAIAAYERALGLEPTLAPAERGIAIAFAAKDDDATAVKHYRRYLELAPDAKDAEEVQKIIKRWEEAEARKKGR
jgi:tetratricopeptide (TPR) repeat protein